LEEMVHVAKEMERQKFTLPLLIGGATTSKAHTAVKIAPTFSQPVVHVVDASRAVGVAGSLTNPQLKPAFVQGIRSDYEKISAQHKEQKSRSLLTIEEARKRRTKITWDAADLAQPEFTGIRVLASDTYPANQPVKEITLSDLVPFIDWSPFFHTWELRGRYPAILEQPEARKLFDDAQKLLSEIISKKQLTLRGVYGIFPANSTGDDVELYTDSTRSVVLSKFHFLRQQSEKPEDQFNHCLADFIAPKGLANQNGDLLLRDHLGAFAVSAGFGAEDLCRAFEADHDDYNSIMTKALADRLAEAFAEYLHKRVRGEWNYGKAEQLTNEELIREKYRGIRPAPGYPACPDHTEKLTLWNLLKVKENTGIQLTESCAMVPGASVSGFYFAHPQARYFALGKIDFDQVADYQIRKQLSLSEIERWLSPWLNYDPDTSKNRAAEPAQRAAGCSCC